MKIISKENPEKSDHWLNLGEDGQRAVKNNLVRLFDIESYGINSKFLDDSSKKVLSAVANKLIEEEQAKNLNEAIYIVSKAEFLNNLFENTGLNLKVTNFFRRPENRNIESIEQYGNDLNVISDHLSKDFKHLHSEISHPLACEIGQQLIDIIDAARREVLKPSMFKQKFEEKHANYQVKELLSEIGIASSSDKPRPTIVGDLVRKANPMLAEKIDSLGKSLGIPQR